MDAKGQKTTAEKSGQTTKSEVNPMGTEKNLLESLLAQTSGVDRRKGRRSPHTLDKNVWVGLEQAATILDLGTYQTRNILNDELANDVRKDNRANFWPKDKVIALKAVRDDDKAKSSAKKGRGLAKRVENSTKTLLSLLERDGTITEADRATTKQLLEQYRKLAENARQKQGKR